MVRMLHSAPGIDASADRQRSHPPSLAAED